MNFLTYDNFVQFKKNVKNWAKVYCIDIDLFFENIDYACIFLKCIKSKKNPTILNYAQISDLIFNYLLGELND